MASFGKKKKYSVSWSSSIQAEFPFAASCKRSVVDYKHKFHCIVCDKPFSLGDGGGGGGGGADDVRARLLHSLCYRRFSLPFNAHALIM